MEILYITSSLYQTSSWYLHTSYRYAAKDCNNWIDPGQVIVEIDSTVGTPAILRNKCYIAKVSMIPAV